MSRTPRGARTEGVGDESSLAMSSTDPSPIHRAPAHARDRDRPSRGDARARATRAVMPARALARGDPSARGRGRARVGATAMMGRSTMARPTPTGRAGDDARASDRGAARRRGARRRAVADRDVERERDERTGGEIVARAATKARGGVRVAAATDDDAFDVAAKLRATAFYDDLLERGEMPFPPRFTATFHREFAQRERRALRERTSRRVGHALESRCFMADVDGVGLAGCLDVSVREGPCASQINGVCVAEGTSYAYIDNVAVDARARRRGAARLMMESASDFIQERGITEVWTHVHADNTGARKLYHAFGFRAPEGTFPETGLPNYFSGDRLKGLILMRAPVPLVFERRVIEDSVCECGARFDRVQQCICFKPLAR